MRVYSYISTDIETGAFVGAVFHEETGPLELAKGEAKQQMKLNNQVAQQQLAMQQKYLAGYQDYVNKILAGGGYMPGVKEALNSQAISSVPQQYNQIAKQLATQNLRTGAAGGGSLPGGGGYARNFGDLYSQEEQTKANLLNQITAGGQQNVAQAEGGVLNAAGITSNVGSSALGSATTSANEANKGSQLLNTIVGGGLGVLGSALGKPGCWIAAEFYGWYTPEWFAVRNWIFGTWWMKPFALIYLAFGESCADWIKRNKNARKATKKLFDMFLRLSHG